MNQRRRACHPGQSISSWLKLRKSSWRMNLFNPRRSARQRLHARSPLGSPQPLVDGHHRGPRPVRRGSGSHPPGPGSRAHRSPPGLETHAPCPVQPVFHACASVGGRVAEALFRDDLCLPSGSNLRQDDLSRVVEGVRRLARRPPRPCPCPPPLVIYAGRGRFGWGGRACRSENRRSLLLFGVVRYNGDVETLEVGHRPRGKAMVAYGHTWTWVELLARPDQADYPSAIADATFAANRQKRRF